MVALVSGNSLGLNLTSLATLGLRGPVGQAAQGRGGDQVYVNLANGNLVVERTDDALASRGLDLALARTYNSQGLLDDDNGDNWQLGVYKKVTGLAGRVNKAGSTVTRTDGDGAASVYIFDEGLGLYRSSDGDGAYDTLAYRGGTWTWTDGQTRVVETYDSAQGGRITGSIDTDGNALTFKYNGSGLITSVRDASGDSMFLDYVGNKLSQVRLVYSDESGTHTQVRTRYEYDTQGRLRQVVTDLSPEDSAVADGDTYWTEYTYEGTSRRIASIAQKDGTSLAFGYVQAGAAWRVETVTDGEGRLTRYSYDSAARTTAVTDPLGNVTTYAYDAAGQLTQVSTPQDGGRRQTTKFAYTAKGDLESTTDGRGNVVTMRYDANGNQTEQQDAAGNTLRRVFSATNQVQIETVYAIPDADGAGPAQPGAALSTRYVYDANDHLRFVVTAEGRVTEYRYNGRGERSAAIQYTASHFDVSALAPAATLAESTLMDWVQAAGTNRTAAQRTDYSYDGLGQLRTATTYANLRTNGSGIEDGEQSIVSYVYGPSGELLQTIDGNGNQSSFAYDGLGRVKASIDANRVATITNHDDAGNRTTVKLASGLWTTSAYNRAGELVSVSQSDAGGAALGTTRYAYDAAGRLLMQTDPSGQRSWQVYDAAGRKVADVDAAGSLTEYRYNAADQVTRSIRYERPADTSLLVDGAGNPTGVSLAVLRPDESDGDRSTWNVYDAAGRQVQRIDGEGGVTEMVYDGAGRVVKVTVHASAVAIAALGDEPDPVATAASPAEDRVTRNFFDSDGNLAGVLDAEGYLTVNSYDAGGRRVGSIAYATPTVVARRATGSLADLLPGDSTENVRQTRFFDRKGRLVGLVDGENYLTENAYDLVGNLVRKIRYAVRVTAGESIETTRPADRTQSQQWTYSYTALNRLATETAPDGTITRHVYDSVGNLIETTRGWQSDDPRTATRRYDVQGRLKAELGGEGSAQLALATSAAQIEAVWTDYAVNYSYDAAGRRVATIDARGNKTLHYYDGHGQLAAEVNALGEVQKWAYDALGSLEQTVRYAGRVQAAVLAGLSGGDFALLAPVLDGLAAPGGDSVTTYSYDRAGRVASSTDALGFASVYDYNAFGEVKLSREDIGPSQALVRAYRYDRRGMQAEITSDPTGFAVHETFSYDPFGRLKDSVDAGGNRTTRGYDRLGRMVSLQKPIGLSTTTYDAFDRVVLETDATGRQTITAYDTAKREVTVTLPDGVRFQTLSNRHGDKVTLIDGRTGITTYSYDKDGRLKDVADQNGPLSHDEWDNAGNRKLSRDANGTVTTYTYDAANRVFTQTVDPRSHNPAGLNLVTTYTYDTAGRVLTVTAPSGITQTAYDAKGQVKTITTDPGGLNLVTAMSYDGRGRTLTVIDPELRQTVYTYDVLGRRKTGTIAGLVTGYFYDPASNVVARQDAAGNVTRYVYDANHRQVYEIDAAGGVDATSYDDAGRVTLQRRHVVALPASWLAGLAPGQVLRPADVEAQLQLARAQLPQSAGDGQQPALQGSSDLAEERILDSNGRLAFTVDAAAGLVQYLYDANGNLIRRTAFATALTADVPRTFAGISARLPAPTGQDRVTVNVYDARNRLTRQLDGAGTLTVFSYDARGNVVERVSYATLVTSIDQTPAASVADRRERYVYDAAGRLVARATAQSADAGNNLRYAVERLGYDDAGNLRVKRQYAAFLSTATFGGDTAAWINSLAAPDARDRVERYDYDAAGRLARKTAADGAVSEYSYDAAGNQVAKVEFAAGPANRTDTANRITRTVYDGAGRAVYEIDPEGAVTRRIYDGAGNLTKTIRYAKPASVPAAFDGNGNAVGLKLDVASVERNLQPDAGRDRVEQRVYDSAGRLAYTMDAEGAVKRTEYDAAGNVKSVTRYAVQLVAWSAASLPDTYTAAQADAALVASPEFAELSRTETFRYDGRGQLLSSTDALGFTETYSYDGVGNKLSFTNKSGNIWNYGYDAAGQLREETGPEVAVTYLQLVPDLGGQLPTGASRILLVGQPMVATPVTTRVRIQTALDYDALGNLRSRTEAANVPGQTRTTTYEYDAVGRQVKTIYPEVGVDDGRTPSSTDVLRHENRVALSSQVEYDALGNAVAGVDVAGQTSRKQYDRSGRVIAEIDALGGVTNYLRNAFGEVEALTRKGQLAGEVDRAITTEYDRAGRAVRVAQPLVQTFDSRSGGGLRPISQFTRTEFDAFGQPIKVTGGGVDVDGKSFTTRISRYYFDRRGLRVGELAELDGENSTAQGGYLTATRYDAEGNATQVTEYAKLIAGADDTFNDYANVLSRAQPDGDDRTLRTEYDAMNRKSSETRVGRYTGSRQADGTVAVDSLKTSFYYDALGNLTGTRDAADALTITVYDALGRRTAVISPTRADIDGRGTVTPVTEFTLDAYGNVLTRTDYAGGATAVDVTFLPNNAQATNYATAGYSVATFDPTRDRRTFFAYDSLGRNIAESDALGVVTGRSYDVNGQLARTWTPLIESEGVTQASFTVNRYDALGRLTAVITPGSSTLDTDGREIATGNVTTNIGYDSFGAATHKTVNGFVVEHNEFDQAGRLWRTEGADGVAKVLLRDADGRVTHEITNPNHDLMVELGGWSDNRITETLYDSLGNVVAVTAPKDAPQTVAPSDLQVAFVQVKFDPANQAMSGIIYEGGTESYEGVPKRIWSGNNRLQLEWPSLAALGGSDVKVEIDYLSPEFRADPDGTAMFGAQEGRYAQILESWQAATGATLTWAADQQNRPGLDKITRIRVSKKDNEGEWVALIDRPGNSAWGVWITAQAPQDPGQDAELWFRPKGSAGGYTRAGAMQRFGDTSLYQYNALTGTADVDYEVRFGVTVADSGSFTVTSKIEEIAAEARPVIVGSEGAEAISWKAPAAGTLQRLRARFQDGGEWVEVFDQRTGLNAGWVLSDGVTDSLALRNLSLGRYEYELLHYTGTGDDTLAAHANGTLLVAPKVSLQPATDAAQVAYSNVLTWQRPDRAGAIDKIQGRTADYSTEPPVIGPWVDFSNDIRDFGGMRGLIVDGQIVGLVQYWLTFHDPALDGADYTEATGSIYIMPTPASGAADLPNALAWSAPKPVLFDGVQYTVQQVLKATNLVNGVQGDVSAAIEDRGGGRSGISFQRFGLIDGVAAAFDYTLEWRVPELGGKSLGTVSGRMRFGPTPPQLVPAQAGQAGRLTWAVPQDLTGAFMQTKLLVRVKGSADWVAQPVEFSGPNVAFVSLADMQPAEYDYRVEYQGRESAGGQLVDWSANIGSLTVVPQPRMGAYADEFPQISGALNRILSWTEPAGNYPLNVKLTTVARDGTVTEESVHPAVNGRQWADFSGKPAGDYDYTLSFTRPDGSLLGTATGTIRRVPEPTLKAGTGTVLAWTAPQNAWPGVTVTQLFEASPRGANAWQDFTWLFQYNPADGTYEADLDALEPSAWDYRVTFSEAGEMLGRANGTLLSLPPPQTGTVAGFGMPASTLSWMKPPEGFHAVVKLVPTSDPTPDFGALPAYAGAVSDYANPNETRPFMALRQGLALADLPAGEYAYQVEYLLEADHQSFGKLQGRLATAPQAQLTNVPGGVSFAQDTPVLSWLAPVPEQPIEVKLVVTGPNGIVPLPDPTRFTFNGQVRMGLDLSGLGSGAYEYAISFRNEITGQTLLSTGTFHHIDDARVEGGVISWDAPPTGATTVFRWRNFDPTRTAPFVGQFTSGFLPLPGGRQGLNLNSLPVPADYDYQIEFLDAAGLSLGATQGEVRLLPKIAIGALGPSVLSWETPPAGITQEVVFRAVSSGPDAPFESLGSTIPMLDGAHSGFDLKDGRAGDYEVRVVFKRGSEDWGTASAIVRLVSQASFGNPGEESVLSWTDPSASVTASLQVWRDGVNVPVTPVSLGGGRSGVNFADSTVYPIGNYTYRLTFTQAGQEFGAHEGGFSIAAPPTLALDSPNALAGSLGTRLTWTTPPAGSTQVFTYQNVDVPQFQGTVSGSDIPSLPGGLSGWDISLFPAGRYSYSLTITEPGGSPVVQEGEFTVVPNPSVTATSFIFPGADDPYYDKVSLLVPFEGENNGKIFKDYSAHNLTPTTIGSRTVTTTAVKQYGESSGYLPPEGPSLAWESPDLLMEGDFSYEVSLRLDDVIPAGQHFNLGVFRYTESANRIYFFLDSQRRIVMNKYGSANQVIGGNFPIGSTATIGIFRSGSTVYAMINGTLVGTTSLTGTVGNGPGRLAIENSYFAGYFDELRVTKGVARHTTSYTPATRSFASLPDNYDPGNAGVLSWPIGAGGQTATLYYNNQPLPATLENGVYSVNLSSLPPANYNFKIVYSDENGEYAQVDSTLSVVLAGAAPGTEGNKAVFAAPLSISKATAPDGNPTTRITFADPGGAALSFRYQDASGWHSLAVSTAGGVGTVDLGQLPSGAYAYELVAVSGGSSYAHSTGTFSLSHAGETFRLPIRTISGVYANSIGQIRWPVPSHPVTQVIFGGKVAGTEQWVTNIVPRQEGSEFVVDAWGLPVGTYDVGIIYTGINPATGNAVWTDAALGSFSVTQTEVPYTYSQWEPYQLFHPQVGLPHINGLMARNVTYTEPGGPTGQFILLTAPNPQGTSYDYNGASYTWTNSVLQLNVEPGRLGSGIYTTDSLGLGFSNVEWIHLQSVGDISVPYTLTYYSNGVPIAHNTGTYRESSGYGYITDLTPSYTPSYTSTEYRLVTYNIMQVKTVYGYSYVAGAPVTYTDAVGGEPVAPTLVTSTLPPIPQYQSYSLLGTQDRYFYRGANPAWRLSSSTVLGARVSGASTSVVHEGFGTTGSLTNIVAQARDVSKSVELALSHQDVSISIADANQTAQLPPASQNHVINLSNTARVHRQVVKSSQYAIKDETRDGTVPVSLPFDMRYVEAALQSTPQAVPAPDTTVRQSYDRWGQVTAMDDARNPAWQTSWRYSAAGQVLLQTKPLDSGPGAISTATYNLQGLTASVTDANGHTTIMRYDNAGNLIGQENADGGHVFNRFDAFGNKTETWVQTRSNKLANGQEDNHFAVTKYRYDLKGQLTTTIRPDADIRVVGKTGTGEYITQQIDGSQVQVWKSVGQSVNGFSSLVSVMAQASLAGTGGSTETYGYDSLGRRIRTTSSAPGAASETERTAYDLRGQVLRQTDADGQATTYRYDVLGRKTAQVDAAGRGMAWDYADASGRAASHIGLDGVTVAYTYTFTGELSAEHTQRDRVIDADGHRAGMHRTYTYNNRGQLTGIVDLSRPGATQTTAYRYDSAGNRTLERTQVQEQDGTKTLQDNYLRYDAQGRLTQVADSRWKINYTYDEVGNRTRMTARSINDSGGDPRQYDYAFGYDAMNRILVENGVVGADGKARISGTQGKEYTYDLAGRRIATKMWGHRATLTVETLDPGDYDAVSGTYVTQTIERRSYKTNPELGETREVYGYDAAGRLTHIGRDGIEIQRRYYDGKGRLIRQETPQALADTAPQYGSYSGEDNYQPPPAISTVQGAGKMLSDLGYSAQSTSVLYEAGSDRISRQSVHRVGYDSQSGLDDGALQANVGHEYSAFASNQLAMVQSQSWGRGGSTSTTTHQWQAIGDVDRQVRTTTYVPGTRSGEVQQHYDGAGQLVSLTQGTYKDTNPDRKYYNDAAGRVLRMTHLNQDRTPKYGAGTRELFLIARGEQLARSADDAIEMGYRDEFGQVMPFDSLANVPRQATGTQTYVVQSGDTLQAIAQAVYGDASLWYAIAEANGLDNAGAYHETNNPTGIRAGQVLTIPDPVSVGAGAKNNATTLRPYDPTEAIGDTSPNLPPPPKKKVSFFKKLVVVIVAIVVTFLSYGALAKEMAAWAAAMLSAAAGSIASQTVGIAIGAQEQFSWKSVALSAISAGITQGLPADFAAGLGTTGQVMAKAAVANALTQGIGVATGLQDKFDWRGVAASAVGAGVGQAVGGTFNQAFGDFGGRLATGLVAGTAAAVMRGGKVAIQQVAVDAFGNALGYSMAEASNGVNNPSSANYENEMDRQSDTAYRARQRAELYGFTFGASSPGLRIGGGSGLKPYESTVAGWSAATDLRIAAAAQNLSAAERMGLPADTAFEGPAYSSSPHPASDLLGRLTSYYDGGVDRGDTWAMTQVSRVRPNGYRPGSLIELARNQGRENIMNGIDEAVGYAGLTGDYRVIGNATQLTAQVDRMKTELGDIRKDLIALGKKPPIDVDMYAPGEGFRVLADKLEEHRNFVRLSVFERAGVLTLNDDMSIRTIGKSQLTAQAFAAETGRQYQLEYSNAVAEAKVQFESGKIPGWMTPLKGVLPDNMLVGFMADQASQSRLRLNWFRSEGVPEFAGSIAQINRNLYDPQGSGNYTRPDVYLDFGPRDRYIFDGSVGFKAPTTPQMRDFARFAYGANFDSYSRIMVIRQNAADSYRPFLQYKPGLTMPQPQYPIPGRR